MAREYTEYYWALDPCCIQRCAKEPLDRTYRITDMMPASRFIKSECAIDFAARVPYCWALGGDMGTLGHPLAAIALNRPRHDRDFSDRDVAFLGAVLPHLSRVLLLFAGGINCHAPREF